MHSTTTTTFTFSYLLAYNIKFSKMTHFSYTCFYFFSKFILFKFYLYCRQYTFYHTQYIFNPCCFKLAIFYICTCYSSHNEFTGTGQVLLSAIYCCTKTLDASKCFRAKASTLIDSECQREARK